MTDELQGRYSAAVTAAACAYEEALGGAGHAVAYRQLLQLAADLAAVSEAAAIALTADEPGPITGRWKDAVAALIEYRLTEARIAVPAWVEACTGQPDSPWEPQRAETPLWFPVDLTAVPDPFLRRGILIEASELG